MAVGLCGYLYKIRRRKLSVGGEMIYLPSVLTPIRYFVKRYDSTDTLNRVTTLRVDGYKTKTSIKLRIDARPRCD